MKTTRLLLALALFLPLAAARAETIETDSGLKIEILTPGEPGTSPEPGDRVTVHYTGRLTDGKKFDSSVDRGEPFSFLVGKGEVIRGWDEGVQHLTVGAKAKLTIPHPLAYGAGGRPPVIPPKATLVFDIELLEVIPEFEWIAPDPEAQAATESGIRYQVLEEGEGEPATADQGVSCRFGIFTTSGKPVVSSTQLGQNIGGVVSGLSLGQFDLPFLQEVAPLMKPGARWLCVVPPGLTPGLHKASPLLGAGSDTIWQLEVVSVNDVPEFRRPADDVKQTTDSGLVYEVIREGEGERPAVTDRVKVHYTGWLLDGTVFDSSHAGGEPLSFPLRNVIEGWTEGVGLMKPGAIYLFEIPSDLAYGANPRPGGPIPPNATLVFLVELIAVQ